MSFLLLAFSLLFRLVERVFQTEIAREAEYRSHVFDLIFSEYRDGRGKPVGHACWDLEVVVEIDGIGLPVDFLSAHFRYDDAHVVETAKRVIHLGDREPGLLANVGDPVKDAGIVFHELSHGL